MNVYPVDTAGAEILYAHLA